MKQKIASMHSREMYSNPCHLDAEFPSLIQKMNRGRKKFLNMYVAFIDLLLYYIMTGPHVP